MRKLLFGLIALISFHSHPLLAQDMTIRGLPEPPATILERPEGVRAMNLPETLSLGLQQNPRIQIASQRVEQARATYEQQRSAKNPKLSLSSSTALQPERAVNTRELFTSEQRPPNFPERFVIVDPLTSQLGLSLQTLLTTFGRVENQIAAAFLQIDVQGATAEIEQLDVRLSIKEAFFRKLQADATVEVNRLNARVSAQTLEDAQALFEQGIMARYDILQAEIELTRAIEDLAQSLTRVDQATSELATVLHERTFSVQPIPPQDIAADQNVQLSALRELAFAKRPELKSILFQQQVARKLLDSAYAENSPELFLSANYNTAFGQSLTPLNIPSLTLQLQWQLFDGGYRKARIRELESVIVELNAKEDQVASGIEAEVEQTWLNLRQSAYNLSTAQRQLEASEEYYDMARQRYINGLATTLEVADSLRNLIAARSRLVNVTYDRELAFARLEQSLGTDIPERTLTTQSLNALLQEEPIQ